MPIAPVADVPDRLPLPIRDAVGLLHREADIHQRPPGKAVGFILLEFPDLVGEGLRPLLLFGEVGSLSTSLGNAVARNDLGPKMDKINDTLDDMADLIKKLPPGIGKEINGAARAGKRRAAA